MERITPEDKAHWLQLRNSDITSTDVSALFNKSPYTTYYELWFRKHKRRVLDIVETERMVWGKKVEPLIAEMVAEKLNTSFKPFKDYVTIYNLKMGASFDFISEDEKTLLEIKNVDSWIYNEQWETDMAPPHIELQVQHQLLVTNLDKCIIAAFVGGNRLELIHRDRNEKVIEAIKEKVADFWEAPEPTPNFETDSDAVMKLLPNPTAGEVLETSSPKLLDLAREYQTLGLTIKDLEKKRAQAKAQILFVADTAEKLVHPEFTVNAKMSKESTVSYVRKPTRSFRVTWKGTKK